MIMDARRKAGRFIVSTALLVAAVAGHNGSGESSGMMQGGSWMHNGWHMTGYNMWGLGWMGLIPGILIWTLGILAIIYLYKQITEE